MYDEYKKRNAENQDARIIKGAVIIIERSNVSDDLYNKIVDWIAACSEKNALSNMPKQDTALI